MKTIAETTVETQLRLEWPIICRLAVKARCLRISLNQVCEAAIKQRLYGIQVTAKGAGGEL